MLRADIYGGDEDGAWVLLEPVPEGAHEGAEMAEAADEMADAAFADAAEAEAVAAAEAEAEAEAEPAEPVEPPLEPVEHT